MACSHRTPNTHTHTHTYTHSLTGYNLDFEPYDSPIKIPSSATNADGLAYAGFMRVFAEALHQHDLELSVDYFSNLAIWNLAAMNSSNLDTIISMDTCVESFPCM